MVEDKLSFSINTSFVKSSGKRKKEHEDQKDFVTGISGSKIERLQSEEVSGPLVIPMPDIKASAVGARYQKYLKKESDSVEEANQDTSSTTTAAQQAGQSEEDIRKLAEEELLKEAQGIKTEDTNQNEEPIDLPLLVKYRNPELDDVTNEDERFRIDVATRPEEATLEDYERIPIEKFGEAYLRGNNWKPGDPVGLTNKRVVQPREFVVRPGYRTGLGVKPEDIVAPTKKKKYIKPGESREDQELKVLVNEDGSMRNTKGLDEKLVPLSKTQMQVGSLVGIIGGPHEGLYARVIKIIQSTDSAVVQLESSHEEIKVPKSDLSLIDERKLSKEHPALKMASDSSKKSSSSQKHDKEKQKEDDKKDKKDTSEDKDSWLFPGLIVRIVSKSFNDGKYYLKKGKIVDVITKSECTVQLLDNKKLVEAKQRYLETVIPKEMQEKVMIVQGPHKGKVGTLMSKEKVGGEAVAVVQLQVDFSVSHYSLDHICQFVPDKSM